MQVFVYPVKHQRGTSHNCGLNPTAVAVAAVADSRAVLAPAAGYAGRYAGLKNSNDE
jgi:hypothetical protein